MPQALLKAPVVEHSGQWKPGQSGNPSKIWQKGVSANPGGKGSTFVEAQSIARQASPQAARTMVELLDDPDPRVRGYAADKVREWAWGKVPDYDPKSEEPETQPIDPSQFTPKQRAMMRQMLQLLLSAAPIETITETPEEQS